MRINQVNLRNQLPEVIVGGIVVIINYLMESKEIGKNLKFMITTRKYSKT